MHRLIAGPGGVYICNECVELCQEIIREDRQEASAARPGRPEAGRVAADADTDRTDPAGGQALDEALGRYDRRLRAVEERLAELEGRPYLKSSDSN